MPVFRRPVVLTAVLALAAVGALSGSSAVARPAATPSAVAQSAAARPAVVPDAVPAATTRAARPAVAALLARTASSGSAPATAATRAAGAAVGKLRPPCAVTAKACVDLSSRQAWLTDGRGTILYGPVKARGGMKSAPSPVGTFSVSKKVKNYHSREFDAPMPYSVFFVPGIAFHQGDPSGPSHGCIRLTRASAQMFFATMQAGDRVQIVG